LFDLRFDPGSHSKNIGDQEKYRRDAENRNRGEDLPAIGRFAPRGRFMSHLDRDRRRYCCNGQKGKRIYAACSRENGERPDRGADRCPGGTIHQPDREQGRGAEYEKTE